MNHLEGYSILMVRKAQMDAELEQEKERHAQEIKAIHDRYRVGIDTSLGVRIGEERERISRILSSSGRKEISDDFGYAQVVKTKRWEFSDQKVARWLLDIGRIDLVSLAVRKREFAKVLDEGGFVGVMNDVPAPPIVEVIGEELRIHITKQAVE